MAWWRDLDLPRKVGMQAGTHLPNPASGSPACAVICSVLHQHQLNRGKLQKTWNELKKAQTNCPMSCSAYLILRKMAMEVIFMAFCTLMVDSEVFSAPWRWRARVRRDLHGITVQGLVGLPQFQIISSHKFWKEVLIKSVKKHMWYLGSCYPKPYCCICSALQLVTVKSENKMSELCNSKTANPSPTKKQAQCTCNAEVGKVKYQPISRM